uniref:Uncharacterized protein n=1 Tax=Anguilla anguilla TaxID=7936 RepID=A0A0E9QJ34_ANGAN
MSLNRTAKN